MLKISKIYTFVLLALCLSKAQGKRGLKLLFIKLLIYTKKNTWYLQKVTMPFIYAEHQDFFKE